MEKETRTVSREAVERLKQAESLDDIKEGLRLSPYVWDGSTESLETYGEYVGAVTEKVFGPAGYWECFTPAERRRLVDSVLGSPVNGDATLVSLERAASEGIEGVARAAKEYFAERAGVGATFYALCTRRDCDTDRIKTRWASAVGAVCGLPWVLSNMHMGRIPRELRPEQFIGGALRQCAQGFWSLDIKGRERGTTLIGMLLSRTERVGLSGVAAHVLVECLIKSSEETAAKSKDREMFVHDILRAVGTGSSGGEGLLWAFLDELERSKASGEQKNAWAKGAVSGRVEGGGKTAQKTIVGRFLCVRGREETLGLLVAALNPLGLLQEASKSAVKAWSETFFTAHAGPELDSYITTGICLMLKSMKREEVSGWGILGPLLQGIQSHMKSSVEHTREFGIKVAKSLSNVLTPDKPFTLGDEENEKENEDTKTKEIEKNTDEEEDKETRKKKCRRKHKTTYDPDEIMTFSEDEEEEEEEEKEETNSEDDSDIDDDGLVAYDMDEDEEEIEEEKADFERGKRRPVYARECIARARESGDNIDELSIALEQLRKILEDDPDDAEEYANEAMGLALDIHPPAGTGGLRRDILILAAINAPRQAARFLTGAFYESGRSVGDRALVLDVVVECAHRLSDIKSAKGSVVHTSPNSGTSLLDAELIPMKKEGQLGNGELVAGQTRRWHTIRTGTLPATGQNKFLRVAGDFFYPLVQQGARKGAGNAVTADLLGEDGYILGLLLETLCVIVECSVGHVGHIRMCETLLRFAGELRYHVDSSVRRGAYRCVWVVAGIGCSSKVLAGSIAECLVDWRDALCVTATEDPDPDCRALACAAITRLKTLADTTLGNTAITYEDLN